MYAHVGGTPPRTNRFTSRKRRRTVEENGTCGIQSSRHPLVCELVSLAWSIQAQLMSRPCRLDIFQLLLWRICYQNMRTLYALSQACAPGTPSS